MACLQEKKKLYVHIFLIKQAIWYHWILKNLEHRFSTEVGRLKFRSRILWRREMLDVSQAKSKESFQKHSQTSLRDHFTKIAVILSGEHSTNVESSRTFRVTVEQFAFFYLPYQGYLFAHDNDISVTQALAISFVQSFHRKANPFLASKIMRKMYGF